MPITFKTTKLNDYFKEHHKTLHAIAARIAGGSPKVGADTLLQEGGLYLQKNKPTVDSEEHLKYRLIRIFKHKAIDIFRREKKVVPLDQAPVQTSRASDPYIAAYHALEELRRKWPRAAKAFELHSLKGIDSRENC